MLSKKRMIQLPNRKLYININRFSTGIPQGKSVTTYSHSRGYQKAYELSTGTTTTIIVFNHILNN